MSDEPLVPTFVPSLITLLTNAERKKGSPLTREEVIAVRDRGVCIMLPHPEALKIAENSSDIDPDQVWEQWQIIRMRLETSEDSEKPRRWRVRQIAAENSLDDLPTDPKRRHEAFIEIFGRQVFSIRNEVLQRLRAIVEAPQKKRDEMGAIHSKEYTAVANLSKESQDAAINLSRKAVDSFLRDLLVLLTHNGLSVELPFGTDHAIAFKLVLQVIDKSDLTPVEEHIVNENGEKVFCDYYGRWLNRHRDA